MTRIRHLWTSAFNLGTARVEGNTAVRSVQLVNGLAMFGLLSSWAALLIILSSGMFAALPMNGISQLAMGLVLWCNHRGRTGWAAGLLVVFMQLAVLGQAWVLGPATGVHFWFLVIVLVPHLLVVNPRYNTWFAVHSLSSAMAFCGIVLWQRDQGQVSSDQAFAYVSVIWSLFAIGYYGRKLNDAWAGRERKAVAREHDNAQRAKQQSEQLERTMASKIETEQKLVEHLFKVSGLNSFSEQLSQATTESEVLALAAAQAQRITAAEWVEVALFDASETRFNCFVLDAKEGVVDSGWKSREGAALIDVVANEKTIMLANNCKEEEDERWQSFSQRGLDAVVILPMQAGPTLIGVLSIGARWSGHFDRLGYLIAQQFSAVLATQLGLRRALGHLESSLDVSDALLVNVLPSSVANRMKQGETQIADRVDNAAVFFCDMVGFTAYSSEATADEVVALLQQVFAVMEAECEAHGVEKNKTIGDAFMAASGVTIQVEDPAHAMASYASAVAQKLGVLLETNPASLSFRMGIHVGPVVAGVIGGHRLFFDVWGDTVNTASRMESNGVVGEISCSNEVREALVDRWDFERHDVVDIKGKGEQLMWLLKDPKPSSGVEA